MPPCLITSRARVRAKVKVTVRIMVKVRIRMRMRMRVRVRVRVCLFSVVRTVVCRQLIREVGSPLDQQSGEGEG